jgi:hypothetical protein
MAFAAVYVGTARKSVARTHLEFVELEKGSHVLIKIFARGDFFEAGANVQYSQPDIGTALVFRSIQPHFAGVLKKWLAGVQSDVRLE